MPHAEAQQAISQASQRRAPTGLSESAVLPRRFQYKTRRVEEAVAREAVAVEKLKAGCIRVGLGR